MRELCWVLDEDPDGLKVLKIYVESIDSEIKTEKETDQQTKIEVMAITKDSAPMSESFTRQDKYKLQI